MRVLIVEDSDIMRREIKRLLSMLPDTTIALETGSQADADAWIAAHPHDWDLALVDLFLATGNGFGVLKSCSSRHGSQKVVVMTNYVNDMVRSRVQGAGADAFFDKTFELDRLGEFCKNLAGALRTATNGPVNA